MERKNTKENCRSGVTLTSKRECAFVLRQVSPDLLTTKSVKPRQAKPDLHELQRSGFTLIELLVVVLIIGILAAVALPQYQKAVDKSRLVQLITAVKAVKNAEEVYYLANGSYTTDWDTLNIDFTGTASGANFTTTNGMTLRLIFSGPTTTAKVDATYTKLPDIYIYHVFDHSGGPSTFDNKLYCRPLSSKEASHQLCKSMSSAPSGEACGNGYRCYVVDKF